MENTGIYSYGPTVVAGRNCFKYIIADRDGRVYVSAIAESLEQAQLMIRLIRGSF